jgi:hypothetical protein
MEYAIEAAAFFNPSLVLAPDQTGLQTGLQTDLQTGLQSEQLRVIFSFRAVGRGPYFFFGLSFSPARKWRIAR